MVLVVLVLHVLKYEEAKMASLMSTLLFFAVGLLLHQTTDGLTFYPRSNSAVLSRFRTIQHSDMWTNFEDVIKKPDPPTPEEMEKLEEELFKMLTPEQWQRYVEAPSAAALVVTVHDIGSKL